MRTAPVLALACAACHGASSDPGAAAGFQVMGAQFVEGIPPEPTGGPDVAALNNLRPVVTIGELGERITGALAPSSEAALLYLEGDIGYWIVPAEPPLIETPDYPSIDVRAGFSAEIEPGPLTLQARAVDGAGRIGVGRVLALTAVEVPPPDGLLVVSLSWDTDADLDLHLVTPDGIEVWSDNPNSYQEPRPGEPPDPPGAWMQGGMLDADSNSGCLIDGRRQENVIWQIEPPVGHYVARVDAFSMCEESHAYWTVEALREGESLGRAEGESLPADTDLPHGAGAGVTALEFDVTGE